MEKNFETKKEYVKPSMLPFVENVKAFCKANGKVVIIESNGICPRCGIIPWQNENRTLNH